MNLRLAILSAVLFLSMAATGFCDNWVTRQSGGYIPTPPINSPISDPFVRKETYSTLSGSGSYNRNSGPSLGTVNRNMSSGGRTNINNFMNPNGTLFNPATAKPHLRSR